MAKRPMNVCKNCGHRWFPKVQNLSRRCPYCAGSDVRIYRNPFLIPIVVSGAIIFFASLAGLLLDFGILKNWAMSHGIAFEFVFAGLGLLLGVISLRIMFNREKKE